MSTQENQNTNVAQSSVQRFRAAVRRAILLEPGEYELFDQIPDIHFERILARNFNGSVSQAERVLFNRHKQIDDMDRPTIEKQKRKIKNLGEAASRLSTAMEKGQRVIFLTDNDNDGSMAQSVLLEFLDQLPDDVRDRTKRAYAQAIGKERGLTLENVDLLLDYMGWDGSDPENPILVVTADIGVNNRASAEAIMEKYPGVNLIVTDHHLPVPEKMIQDGPRCLLFNPQVEPTEHFRRRNISGADTLSVLLREVMADWTHRADLELDEGELPPVALKDAASADARMRKLGSWSNLLDYVEADVVDMPLRPHAIEKAMRLRTLLNVSNSMGPLVTNYMSDEAWEKLAQEAPGLDVEFVKEASRKVHGLNAVARRLLAFLANPEYAQQLSLVSEKSDSEVDTAMAPKSKTSSSTVSAAVAVATDATAVEQSNETEALDVEGDDEGARSSARASRSEFYSEWGKIINFIEDYPFDSPNPNYISQLRPWLFRFGAVDNKPVWADLINEQMLAVYKQLQSIEKSLLEHLRGLDLLERVQNGGATIVWPRNAGLTKVFPRKMLGKAFNEDNNGFLLILDESSNAEWSGSMRSLYPIDEIIPDRKALGDKLGISIEVLGHSKAAGFKITAQPGKKVTRRTIERLAREINEGVKQCRANEKASSLPFLDADFATLPLINRINVAVRAHLSNMQGIPAALSLGEEGTTDVAITDNKTTEQILLSEVVGRRRYGWQAIRTSFHGDAVIVPIEQLRTIAQGQFRQRLRLGYMDDGAFVAQQAFEPGQTPLIPFRANRKEESSLVDYYNEHFAGDRVQEISREQIAALPYFRTARTRAWDFARFERLIIDVLDSTKQDVFAVIDVEATGLGRAPKCFNIGATNLFITPNSGFKLDKDEFARRVFRSPDGLAHLLDSKDVKEMVSASSLSDEQRASYWIVYAADERGGIDFSKGYALPKRPDSAIYIDNYKVDEDAGTVLVNRRIQASALAYLIKDDDFAITPEMTNLTGITPSMLEKIGRAAQDVDRSLEKFYSSLKKEDGTSMKVVFSAHNLPYDKGVITSNLPRLNNLMDQSVLCDTARVARQDKLAYDDTPTATFVGVDAIPRGRAIYFYDSPYSSYSLSTFLARSAAGKSGEFPDTTGKYMIRYRAEKGELSFVDKQALTEQRITQSPQELAEFHRQVHPIPSQSVRYSVERLSSRAMIRNIILSDAPAPVQVELTPEEKAFADDLAFFQARYRFEGSLEDNINDFRSSRSGGPDVDMLQEVGKRFLAANRDLQGRFHDSWIYEQVLSRYEPAVGVQISQDIVLNISYQTSLDPDKITEVFDKTLAFKRKYNLHHALVHEQHNNIRQVSEDGQGLADTAYESVLPGLLAAAKRHNPYTDKLDGAVDLFVEVGMRGTMKQLFVKDRHQDKPAADSFSMRQMLAFDRPEMAAIVEAAKKLEQSGWVLAPQVKFGLKSGDLPKGSAIYATPKGPLSSEELEEAKDRLREVMLFEQIRLSAVNNITGSANLRATLSQVAEDAKERLETHKKWLDKRFSEVQFDRREASVRKLSDIVAGAVEGEGFKVPPSMLKAISVNPGLMTQAVDLVLTHLDIATRINRVDRISPETAMELANFAQTLARKVEGWEDAQLAKPKRRRFNDDGMELDEYLNSPVRGPMFLPNLDIRRAEPLEFIVEQGGSAILAETLLAREQIEERFEEEVELPQPEALKSKRSRKKVKP